MIALFCGSRDWPDREAIRADIEALPDDTIVVEGGARGADRIAREEAGKRGLHVATVNAYWTRRGKAAGMERNAAMLLLRPDVVYAYPLGGPGTWGMVNLAERAGIQVHLRPLKRVS